MPLAPPSTRALDRRRFLALCAALSAATAVAGRSYAAGAEERADLKPLCEAEGVAGNFVLFDPTDRRMITDDGERSTRRYVPASTFKIANSIIALETGVVRDESEIIPYGGKPQPGQGWRHPDTLHPLGLSWHHLGIILRRCESFACRNFCRRSGYSGATAQRTDGRSASARRHAATFGLSVRMPKSAISSKTSK